jgi:hypothetical protein
MSLLVHLPTQKVSDLEEVSAGACGGGAWTSSSAAIRSLRRGGQVGPWSPCRLRLRAAAELAGHTVETQFEARRSRSCSFGAAMPRLAVEVETFIKRLLRRVFGLSLDAAHPHLPSG